MHELTDYPYIRLLASMAYYVLFFFLSLLVLLSNKLNDKQRRVSAFIAAVSVILFQGLRWERGTDWDTYYAFFQYSDSPPYFYEYGWWLINSLIRDFTGSYNLRLIIESALIIFLNLRFAKYIGIKNLNAIVLASFTGCIFPVRLGIASAIVLNSYRYIIEQNFKKFALLVLLASTIHIASLLILPIYFVPKKEFKNAFFLLAYFGSIIVGYMTGSVLNILNNLSALFMLGGLEGGLQEKVDGYLAGGIQDYAVRSTLSIILSFISGAFFIVVFDYFRSKNYKDANYLLRPNLLVTQYGNYVNDRYKYTVLFNMYVVGMCLNRIVAMTVPYLSRVGILMSGGFSSLLLLGIEKRFKYNITFIYFIYIIYQFMQFYSRLHGMYEDLFLPYKSIL